MYRKVHITAFVAFYVRISVHRKGYLTTFVAFVSGYPGIGKSTLLPLLLLCEDNRAVHRKVYLIAFGAFM